MNSLAKAFSTILYRKISMKQIKHIVLLCLLAVVALTSCGKKADGDKALAELNDRFKFSLDSIYDTYKPRAEATLVEDSLLKVIGDLSQECAGYMIIYKAQLFQVAMDVHGYDVNKFGELSSEKQNEVGTWLEQNWPTLNETFQYIGHRCVKLYVINAMRINDKHSTEDFPEDVRKIVEDDSVVY